MRVHAMAVLVAAVLAGAAGVAQKADQGVVTTGEVEGKLCPGAVERCTSGIKVNASPQVCGTATAPDGSKWAVPSDIHEGPFAVDTGSRRSSTTRNG